MGPCNLEIHKIHAILVKSMDFAPIWPNKFLSGEFHVFRGKWSSLALGIAMEIWR